jgi:hypothetical protein
VVYEYKRLGYVPEELGGYTPYAPILADQPLMPPAEEEELFGRPADLLPAPEAAARLPDAVTQAPFVALDIGGRNNNDSAFSLPGPSWGVADAYAIQPRIYPLHDSTAFEPVGGGGVRVLEADPALAHAWRPWRGGWQAAAADVPALMSGPDPEDAMPDAAGDRDKPPAPISVATASVLAPLLPELPPRTLRDAGGAKIELPRNTTLAKQDADAHGKQLTRTAAYADRLEAYTKGLEAPGLYSVRL